MDFIYEEPLSPDKIIDFSLKVFTDLSEKYIIFPKDHSNLPPPVWEARRYHSAGKAQVEERIFKLSPI